MYGVVPFPQRIAGRENCLHSPKQFWVVKVFQLTDEQASGAQGDLFQQP